MMTRLYQQRRPGRILVIIALILCLLIIPSTFWISENNRKSQLIAIAVADKSCAYVGEAIHFSGKDSRNNIDSYFWDFTDGNHSKDAKPSHSFETGGWYNVTLSVSDREGRKASSNLLIGIQIKNRTANADWGELHNFNPTAIKGHSIIINTTKNIGNPNISFSIRLTNVYGTVGINMYAGLNEAEQSTQIVNEDLTLNNREYLYNKDINSQEFPMGCDYIQIDIRLILGRWSSLSLDAVAIFLLV